MELALAELALEETPEAEEDIDFVVEKGMFDLFYITPLMAQFAFGACHHVRGGGYL